MCRSLVYVFVRETNADICGTLSTPRACMSLTTRRICARVCVDVSVVLLRVMVRIAAREVSKTYNHVRVPRTQTFRESKWKLSNGKTWRVKSLQWSSCVCTTLLKCIVDIFSWSLLIQSDSCRGYVTNVPIHQTRMPRRFEVIFGEVSYLRCFFEPCFMCGQRMTLFICEYLVGR